mmetsp:Transcript_13816/g.37981  ORF Transcript_13816/g.37981 Transcript_13816/m.37981 type:complete len:273 (-) Transcript_13816:187-1005(-)|eukprot:CAMPEP_0198119460 /NCGR_PEP_ID=MMETSP1442-20131203/25690_1 /TAXON_ID= /ORGANISM="Craspedostauros australis, Strain CCMP3328" /LENGTH=272 /DNA_ID=CAMNT_0043777931 /DNA_START=186 /DNA_END=1004 /DNA_ORIENTATION=-
MKRIGNCSSRIIIGTALVATFFNIRLGHSFSLISSHGLSFGHCINQANGLINSRSLRTQHRGLRMSGSNEGVPAKTHGQDKAQETKQRIEWIIRPSTIEDDEELSKLMLESYSKLLAADYNDDFLEKAVPMISKPRPELLTCGTWYVAQHPQTNQLVGCGGWTKTNPNPSKPVSSGANNSSPEGPPALPPPHLRHFATSPSATRMGVASAIWSRCQNDIIEQCGADTTLEVFSTISAEGFYQSLGFEVEERKNIPVGGLNFPCTLMRRPPPI